MVAFHGVMRRPLAAQCRVRAFVLAAVALGAVTAATPARAQGDVDDDRAAQRLFDRAEAEDTALDFARAAADYDAAAARSPSSPAALRARARARVLREHGEGGFGPYAHLERVRRDPALASDPAALDDLAHLADGFPPGPVRVEARALVAEAYLGRLHRRRDAIPLLRHIADDPAADTLSARHARHQLVTALLDEGDLDGARDASGAEADLVRDVRTALVRRRLHVASVVTLAAFALFAARAILAARGRALPLAAREVRAVAVATLGFAAWAAIAGGGLASAYESGNALPFALLGAAIVPLVFTARAWAAAGEDHAAARAGRGALAAVSAFAAAFLVLESIDPAYLSGFGL